MLQALIFDVDGTLADTESLHREAFNHAFAQAGLRDGLPDELGFGSDGHFAHAVAAFHGQPLAHVDFRKEHFLLHQLDYGAGNIHASYLHVHPAAVPEAIVRFMDACAKQ